VTKVRTIKETIKELRAIDPGCQLTEWQFRQLVKEEKIPAMMAGKKALLLLSGTLNDPSNIRLIGAA